ncbi:MAG: hypothetical protein JWP12_1718 [Bacteroidetes bacterium]|nr:hypothetical protein [Bacteroidota bacterium]
MQIYDIFLLRQGIFPTFLSGRQLFNLFINKVYINDITKTKSINYTNLLLNIKNAISLLLNNL